MTPEEIQQQQFTAQADAQHEKLNLAEDLSKEERNELAQRVVKGYDHDKHSRMGWEKQYDEWLKLAMQICEPKNFPWPKASNIKYPILSIASMQFAARAYPSLVPSDGRIVKQRVVGQDPTGEKVRAAKCTGEFMSWQLMEQMECWEDEMDRMLMMLPIVGIAFKKTWWDPIRQLPRSEVVHAKDLVVNYWAKDLEQCERKTQEYYLTRRQIEENIRGKLWLEVDEECFSESAIAAKAQDPLVNVEAPPELGPDTPFLVIEQHHFEDIDGDGYPEPVITTVLHKSGKLLRVTPRYDAENVHTDSKGKIILIDPTEYYTKFSFFPNPDGGFYDIGFGLILSPLNESINTVVNQLVDAGTLSNMQGGWMSKALRIKQGDYAFTPGEWKQVDSVMDDLKKGILPHQYKEPSAVLLNLLQMLLQGARELSSMSEIMVGKMPGQNTPAYTTKETVEQGMKVFTAVYKRIFRGLAREFRKLYRVNRLYVQPEVVRSVTDAQYDIFVGDPNDIVPAADPQAVSAATKSAQAQQLIEMVKVGAIPNPPAAFKKVMELLEVEWSPEMVTPPPPKPDPKQQAEMQKIQAQMQADKEMHQLEMQAKQAEIQMQQQIMQLKLEFEKAKLQLEAQKLQLDFQRIQMEAQAKQQEVQANVMQTQVMHQQEMEMQREQHAMQKEQGAEQHKQKLQQMKETNANKQSSVSGLAKPGGNKGSAPGGKGTPNKA